MLEEEGQLEYLAASIRVASFDYLNLISILDDTNDVNKRNFAGDFGQLILSEKTQKRSPSISGISSNEI